jgi:bifunctional non-homologous end joining protein LigD
MLATRWRAPFSDPTWLFEPKWDGYRILLGHDGDGTRLWTRRGNDATDRFPELTTIGFDRPVVLDGEVVVFDDEGRPSFDLLQARAGRPEGGAATRSAVLIVFDVLHLGTDAVIDRPLEARLELLDGMSLPGPLQRSPVTPGEGEALWVAVVEQDLEGMVAKRVGSIYRPGVRSEDWRKIHHVHTAKAVVGGFTPGAGGRSDTLGSLLVGLWDGTRLRYIGAVGTGFSDAALRAISEALEDQTIGDVPFHDDPGLPSEAVWIEPVLVAAIGYGSWTSAGRLRHPRFLGFVDDPSDEITFDREGPSGR